MTKATIVIDDMQCTLYKGGRAYAFEESETLLDIKEFEIYINTSELDVSFKSLPRLSFFDQHLYLRQKRKNQNDSILTNTLLIKEGQIEITCPKTQLIDQCLEYCVKNKKTIKFIKPFLFSPCGIQKDRFILVVSAHNHSNLRQTAYLNGTPVFTRLTEKQDLSQEILTTLAYLKNQHHFSDCIIQCQLNMTDCQLIQNALGHHTELDINLLPQENSIFNISYQFDLPKSIKTSNKDLTLRRVNKIAAAFLGMSLTFGAWQFISLRQIKENHKSATLKIIELDQQIRLTKTKLPLDKILPPVYSAALSDTSPILLFHKISEAMPVDLTLSALKWENLVDEEKLLLELKLVHHDEEADQNIDVVQDFQIALQGALPGFIMQTQSLPHASGNNETFAGTVTQEDLTLSGDKAKAMIEFRRKKKS